MFLLLLILIILILGYYYLIKPQLYWKEINVIQGYPIPLFGDNLKLFFRQEAMIEMILKVYNRATNERYCGMYEGRTPSLMIRDPELIKQITIKDFDHFVDHRTFKDPNADPIWSRSLFLLTGDSWREMRATLSPTFTSSKMRAMFTLMEKSAQQYVNYFLEKDEEVIELELKDSFTRFANDVIANCAFGITVDSLKEPTNPFYVNGKSVTDLSDIRKILRILLVIVAPKIAKFFKISMFPNETAIFFKTLVKDTINLREEQHIVRADMINLLMEARKGQLKFDEPTDQKDTGFATVEESHVGKTSRKIVEMTDTDMAAQALIFFFAGFDTISTMMSFMCYELAIHPDIQEKLRQEVDDTFMKNDGELTYDKLNKMKYLDMVVSESLRRHAVAIAVDRICTKAYTIQPERMGEQPIHLKPGDVIWIPIVGIHHDERFYPNPKKFDPERFSEENKTNIKPYSYIPFGSGPRNCIGSRFALMEVKTLVVHILAKFELVVIDKTVIPMKYARNQFNPAMEGGCWVGFKRRINIPPV